MSIRHWKHATELGHRRSIKTIKRKWIRWSQVIHLDWEFSWGAMSVWADAKNVRCGGTTRRTSKRPQGRRAGNFHCDILPKRGCEPHSLRRGFGRQRLVHPKRFLTVAFKNSDVDHVLKSRGSSARRGRSRSRKLQKIRTRNANRAQPTVQTIFNNCHCDATSKATSAGAQRLTDIETSLPEKFRLP